MLDKFYILLMLKWYTSKGSGFEISFDLYIHAYNGQLVRFWYLLPSCADPEEGGQGVWTPPPPPCKI